MSKDEKQIKTIDFGKEQIIHEIVVKLRALSIDRLFCVFQALEDIEAIEAGNVYPTLTVANCLQ